MTTEIKDKVAPDKVVPDKVVPDKVVPDKAALTAASKVKVKNFGTKPYYGQFGILQPSAEGFVTLAELQCHASLVGLK